jgi:hypothetical protein
MRARDVLPPLAALALACLAAPGCLLESARRDGAPCSQTGSCPGDQQCSNDGQCLFRCPTSGCSGSDCGCGQINRPNMPEINSGWTCLDDGLCHFACPQGAQTDCYGYMNCDTSLRVCRPACSGPDECASGAACVPVPGLTGGDRPPNYCVGTGAAGDGGVGDGGVGDGGGNRYETLVSVGAGLILNGLAVGGNEVFWADGSSDAIWKCSKEGCATPTRLTQSATGGVRSLVADVPGTIFFWGAADGKLRGCSTGGCSTAPTFQVTYQGNGIAVDGENVYYFDGANIRTCAQLGCLNPRNLTTAGMAGELWALGVGLPGVFWTLKSQGTVYSCSTAGCGGAPPVFAQGEDSPQALAFLEDNVFWRNGNTIRYCSGAGCGGTPQTVVSFASDPLTGAMNRLAVAPHGVYWDAQGTLYRCADPECSGGEQTLTTDGASGQHYATDSEAVFFFEHNQLKRYAP